MAKWDDGQQKMPFVLLQIINMMNCKALNDNSKIKM